MPTNPDKQIRIQADPAIDAVSVTPNDSTNIGVFRGLFIGGAGNLSITTVSGNNVTFTGVLAGQILPVSGTHVRTTGTSATNIVALY